jgi:hypothetical protein
MEIAELEYKIGYGIETSEIIIPASLSAITPHLVII